MKTIACVLGSLLLLTGCASNPYSAAQKAGIHTVQLADTIDSIPDLRYGLDAAQPDDLRSTVYTEMVNDVGQDGLRRIKAAMKKDHIDIPHMIYDRLNQKLHSQSHIVVTDQPPADGVFAVKILQYGFTDMPFSLMHETPFIMLQLTLTNPAGHAIWTRKAKCQLPADDEAGASWEEYETHPDELRDDWTAQVNQAVNQLLPP